jgi:hypothetical protein
VKFVQELGILKVNETDRLGSLNVDCKIMLKKDFRKIMCEVVGGVQLIEDQAQLWTFMRTVLKYNT